MSLGKISQIMLAVAATEIFFTSMLKEGSPVVLVCAIFGALSGLMLSVVRNTLEMHPGILILYPVLLATLGDMGSMIGSTSTSRLHLGQISPHISTLRKLIPEVTTIEVSSLIMHIMYAVLAYIISLTIFLNPSIRGLILTSVLSNLISFVPICVLSFMIAAITFRRGLDPDNFVIPLETSISDTLSTLSLSIAITITYMLI